MFGRELPPAYQDADADNQGNLNPPSPDQNQPPNQPPPPDQPPPVEPAPMPEDERRRRIGQLLSTFLYTEVPPPSPGHFDPTEFASSWEAWRNLDERQELLDFARDNWEAQTEELHLPRNNWDVYTEVMGLPRNDGEAIAQAALLVWYNVNGDRIYEDPASHPVDPESVARSIAYVRAELSAVLGDSREMRHLIDGYIGRMVDQAIDRGRGRNLRGDVSMADVDRLFPDARKKVIERRSGQADAAKKLDEAQRKMEEEEKKKQLNEQLNMLAERLTWLGPAKLKQLKADLLHNIQLPEGKKKTAQEVLGREVMVNVGTFAVELKMGKERQDMMYWYEVVRRAHDEVEYPEARMRLRKEIVAHFQEALKYGPESALQYVEDLFEPLQWAYFVGEFTPELREIVPHGMTLREYSEEVDALAMLIHYDADATTANRLSGIISSMKELGLGVNGSRKDLERLTKLAETGNVQEDDMRQLQMLELMQQTDENRHLAYMLQERGMKEYLFLAQTQEMILKAKKLPKDKKLALVQRLWATMLRAGRNSGVAQMEAGALSGDARAFPEESNIQRGMQLIQQALGMESYMKREEEHRQFGFHPPEVLSRFIEQKVPITVEVRDVEWMDVRNEVTGVVVVEQVPTEIREISFEISIKDVEAELFHVIRLAKFKANKGEGSYSRAEMQMMIMRRAMLRKMGYTTEQVDMWEEQQQTYDAMKELGNERGAEEYKAAWTSHYPEVVRTNQISFSDLLDVEGLDELCGENFWMIMGADGDIRWKLTDYMLLPTDRVKRRERLAHRDALADYIRYYDKFGPPAQLWQELAIQPDYDSLVVVECLEDVLKNDELLVAGLDMATPQGKKMLEVRQKWIEQVVKVDQLAPDQAKWLGAMLMGVGYFKPEGKTAEEKMTNYINIVNQFMQGLERLGINRLRPFELWPDVVPEFSEKLLWEAGLVKQQFLNQELLEGDELMQAVWAGMPFEKWLGNEGLNAAELDRLRYRNFINNFRGELRQAGVSAREINRLTNTNDIARLMRNYRDFYTNRPPLSGNENDRAIEKRRREGEARRLIAGSRQELAGQYGWQCFLENASYALYERSRAAYKGQDSALRYPDIAKGNIDQAGQMMELGMEQLPGKPQSASKKAPASVVIQTGGDTKVVNAPATMDTQGATIVENTIDNLVREEIEGIAKEHQKNMNLGGFIPKSATAALYRSYIRSYAELWGAFNVNAPHAVVLDIHTDPNRSDFGTGNSFSVREITEEMLNKRWEELFAGSRGEVQRDGEVMQASEVVKKFWRRHMLYFVEAAETMQKGEEEREKGRVAIGATSTFVPNVKLVKEELEQMIEATKERLKEKQDKGLPFAANGEIGLENLLERLEEMERNKMFGWSLLRGRRNMTVVEVVGAVAEPLMGSRLPPADCEQVVAELVMLEKKGVTVNRMDAGPYWVWSGIDVSQRARLFRSDRNQGKVYWVKHK